VKDHVDKFVFMTHLDKEVEKVKKVYGNNTKRITLTPLVTDSHYILPLYSTDSKDSKDSKTRKTLAIIGWCDKENKDFEDINYFLENNRDKDLIIFSKQSGRIGDLRELERKHINAKIILNCDTVRMIKILKNVDYVWIPVSKNSVHLRDRSTGALPLSYNLGIPLLVPKVFNDIYKLEGNIVYEKSIREVNFEKQKSVEMELFTSKTIEKNLKILEGLMEKRERCLITGGCGFVGRYFSERLKRKYNVTIVDNMESTSAKEPRYSYIKQDVIQYLEKNSTSFDLVIHLAAVVGGRQVIENEPFKVSKDLIIDAVFFEWVARTKPKKVIYFSSSAVYPIKYQGEVDYKKLREDMVNVREDIGVPDLTYGWAKLTGEFLAKIAHEKYGIDIVCYRPFSGYGEEQHETYPFPSIIERACRREDPLVVWSNSVRDFVHIDDVYKFVMDTYDRIHDGSALNIGTGIGTSFVELAKLAAKEVGYEPAIKVLDDKPKGVYYRVSAQSIGTAQNVGTGTENSASYSVSLEEGVKRMVKAKSMRYMQVPKTSGLSKTMGVLTGFSVDLSKFTN
jgi:GDP-L-fucose synthase